MIIGKYCIYDYKFYKKYSLVKYEIVLINDKNQISSYVTPYNNLNNIFDEIKLRRNANQLIYFNKDDYMHSFYKTLLNINNTILTLNNLKNNKKLILPYDVLGIIKEFIYSNFSIVSLDGNYKYFQIINLDNMKSNYKTYIHKTKISKYISHFLIN